MDSITEAELAEIQKRYAEYVNSNPDAPEFFGNFPRLFAALREAWKELTAADSAMQGMIREKRAAVAEEREACARVADDYAEQLDSITDADTANDIAAAIRRRENG